MGSARGRAEWLTPRTLWHLVPGACRTSWRGPVSSDQARSGRPVRRRSAARLIVALLLSAALAACSNAGTASPPDSAGAVDTAAPTVPSASSATPAGARTITASPTSAASGAGTWRGLVVAPEQRCAPYNADDYPYSQALERRIVADMGGIIYGPYSGTWFASTSETDIEHIVARSEAHDSGLCAAAETTRRRFAADLLNLTLASPTVNRAQKSGKDAAGWLPERNRCWFANRVVEVRRTYALTIDDRERDVLEGILASCVSTALIVGERSAEGAPSPTPDAGGGQSALQRYDDNANGRITCAEARSHGIAPVRREHPAYPYMDDRDNDGVVCE